jgi:hypothetical protein
MRTLIGSVMVLLLCVAIVASDSPPREEQEENERPVRYEAEWRVDGREVEVQVAADGTVLDREDEEGEPADTGD